MERRKFRILESHSKKQQKGSVIYYREKITHFFCHHHHLHSIVQTRLVLQPQEKNSYQSANDTALAEFINKIKAVDNHAHANTIDPDDKGSDALPLDGLGNIQLPARVRPESQTWIDAATALYGFTDTVLNEKSIKNLIDTQQQVRKEKAEKFPEWALNQAGIEVMFANRITIGQDYLLRDFAGSVMMMRFCFRFLQKQKQL